ncbi:hypothetical protein ABZ016_13905 [Streptomyces sp. NPDC006372]|uniref:Mu transposase domain-containing protein n=1 Tax=Streptomyces sp. NPDC006372 TaxID=3155599 RepID=UPI0033AE8B08
MPEVSSLAELNEMVEQWDLHDGRRRIGSRPRTIDEYFAVEQPLLLPLPDEPFETGRVFTPRVDRYSQITVRTNRYSVPVPLHKRQGRHPKVSNRRLVAERSSAGLKGQHPERPVEANTSPSSSPSRQT